MKIYYDTEFLEDGRTVDLISIGMVADDGRELYLVNQAIQDDDELHERLCRHRWLMENVVPGLPLRKSHRTGEAAGYTLSRADNIPGAFHLDRDDNRIVPRSFIRNAVRDFILATPDPQLWAWYAAYDHVVYAQLFGRMVSLPDGLPMFTCDLKQEAERLGNPTVPEQASGQHNALEDARHNRVIAAFLERLDRPLLREEWGVQAEDGDSTIFAGDENDARNTAERYSRFHLPGGEPTPYHVVRRVASEWRLADHADTDGA